MGFKEFELLLNNYNKKFQSLHQVVFIKIDMEITNSPKNLNNR